MTIKLILTGVLVAVSAFALCAEERYFFAYADAQTVDLARRTGNDPLAAIGREIPTDRPFMVPAKTLNGGRFKVRFCSEWLSDPGNLRGNSSFHFSFDRTTTNDGPINPPLDETSFRKLFPANQQNLVANFSNFGSVPAWLNTGPVDENHDGVQDIITMALTQNKAFTRAVETGGGLIFSKPIGLGGGLRVPIAGDNLFSYGYRVGVHQPIGFCDVEWANDLAEGETYGFAPGETGLDIHTSDPHAPGDGVSTWTAPSFGITSIGARYNLVAAVPEPATLLALSAGMLALRRRRK